MSYYKIRNLTGSFNKRDINKNRELKINLFDKHQVEEILLTPSDTLYLNLNSIPIEIHKLRMKGFISVVEIGKNEFLKYNRTTIKLETQKKQNKPQKKIKEYKKEIKKDEGYTSKSTTSKRKTTSSKTSTKKYSNDD